MSLATSKLQKQTGRSFSPADVIELRKLVALAFDEADVLGVLFGQKLVEHRLNKLTSLYRERVASGRGPAELACCRLNHDILPWLPGLLAGRRVSVISCRDVKPVLESEWGVKDVAVYQVPSQHLVRDVDGAYEAALHHVPIWPDVHSRLQAELTIREPGEVFLVGAGLFGKDLCIHIRDQGGIALDLGSALDNIAGKITRGPKRRILLLHAEGMSVPEIAAHVRERYGVDADHAKIREITEDPSRRSADHAHDLAALRSAENLKIHAV